MPRGIPAYKSDPNVDQNPIALKFTTFNVPNVIPIGNKLGGSTYVRADQQSIFSRTEQRSAKRKRLDETWDIDDMPPTGPRGSNVIVIQPGSRNLRIGRASDLNPIIVPHVIARKTSAPRANKPKGTNPLTYPLSHGAIRMNRVETARRLLEQGQLQGSPNLENFFDQALLGNEKVDKMTKPLNVLRQILKTRLGLINLRLSTEATEKSFHFNSYAEPIPLESDSYKVNWTVPESSERFIVGQRALDLPDPAAAGFELFWPLKGANFNFLQYTNRQVVLNDLETIWTHSITQYLKISRKSFKHYSVMLVIPDCYDYNYLKEVVNLLLDTMEFKEVCLQQEATCGAYGAGLPSACVADVGASKISVACVEDGILLPDTRMTLNYGGDDVSLLLNALLERIHFPYVDMDPSKQYDWKVLENVKHMCCTMNESTLASNAYDVVVRRPNTQAQRYQFRLYDEVIVAPLLMFEPRVLDFEEKVGRKTVMFNPEVDDLGDVPELIASSAMTGSTTHLQQPSIDSVIQSQLRQQQIPLVIRQAQEAQQQAILAQQRASAAAQPAPPPHTPVAPPQFNPTPAQIAGAQMNPQMGPQLVWRPPILSDVDPAPAPQTNGDSSSRPSTSQDRTPSSAPTSATVIPRVPSTQPIPGQPQPLVTMPSPPIQTGSGIPLIQPIQQPPNLAPDGTLRMYDVVYEASKIPLDIAVFNSTRASGNDRGKKLLGSVLLLGGGSLLNGLIPQLEGRLQGLMNRYLPNNDSKPQVITPPKDVDPRVVVWKGAALFAKLETASDLWIKQGEWEMLGTRAFKERTLFI